MHKTLSTITLTFLALTLACGSNEPKPDANPTQGTKQAQVDTTKIPSTKVIHLYGNTFHPSALTIAPGSTIEFINDDPEQHNITITELGVDQTLQTNASFAQKFEKAGVYKITNRFANGTMTATINVK